MFQNIFYKRGNRKMINKYYVFFENQYQEIIQDKIFQESEKHLQALKNRITKHFNENKECFSECAYISVYPEKYVTAENEVQINLSGKEHKTTYKREPLMHLFYKDVKANKWLNKR